MNVVKNCYSSPHTSVDLNWKITAKYPGKFNSKLTALKHFNFLQKPAITTLYT